MGKILTQGRSIRHKVAEKVGTIGTVDQRETAIVGTVVDQSEETTRIDQIETERIEESKESKSTVQTKDIDQAKNIDQTKDIVPTTDTQAEG